MQCIPSFGFLFYKSQDLKQPVYAYNRIYAGGFSSSNHCHDFPQIWYCRGGKHFHQVGETVYQCTKGAMVIVPAGIYHTLWVDEGDCSEVYTINLSYEAVLNASPELYPNIFTNLFLLPFQEELGKQLPIYRTIGQTSQSVVEDCISWLCMLSFAVEGMVQTQEVYEKMERFLSVEEFYLPEEYRKRALDLIHTRIIPIFRVISYLNIHYPEKITEDTLLISCGISRAGLYRYFKRIVGHTYSQYLQQLRVRRAYFYIKHTTYSLTYISDICGFFDVHHMSRLFTKYIGESPRERRKYLRRLYE